jgi:hypothetical protein
MILFGFLAVVLAGVGFSLIVGREVGPRPLLPALILLVTAVTVTGLFLVRATSAFGIDVVDLHYAAADALQSGLSPYGLAVEVENGSPVAPPNSTIVGYPYPPLTALLYSASVWLFDDPRWIGLLAWLATLGLAGAIASRSERPLAGVVVSALAALPTWTLMIQSGSTEVLTLGLIAAALAFWRSGTFLGPVALGLAMASKQYFILSLPLLLIHPATRGRRAVIAVASASMTLLPLALDLQNAWGALVMFHANTPPRPDSSNLVGLLAFLGYPTSLPLSLVLGFPLAAAVVLAFRGKELAHFVTSLATVLGVFFLLTSQAFGNYWFLVGGLCGLALTLIAAGNEQAGSVKSTERPSESREKHVLTPRRIMPVD